MPYQAPVTIAEERLRESGQTGRRVSSEDDLIRMLRNLLPGWDIDIPTNSRGETQEEVVGSWGKPGLIVYHYPQLASMPSGGYSDALAGITMPQGMSERDRVFMFLYQDISQMNELIVIHEAAHALTYNFNAGHSDRWLDTYLEMLQKAGLNQAVNLISFMTGKRQVDVKHVEASMSGKVFIRGKVHYAHPSRKQQGRPMPICGTRSSTVLPSVVGDEEEVNCQKCLNIKPTAMRKGAPFAGYDDFDDCVSKNRDKDDPEAYCGSIKSKTEGRRLARLRRVAHDSGDGMTIYHCPFCGSGNVTARSDGGAQCGFCKTSFTIQVQPSHSDIPQTVNGNPMDLEEMPGEPAGGLSRVAPTPEDDTIDFGQAQPPSDVMDARSTNLTASLRRGRRKMNEQQYVRSLARKYARKF